MPLQERQQLLHLRRRTLDELHERRVRTAIRGATYHATGGTSRNEPRRLDGQAGQGLAPRGRPSPFGRDRNGLLEMAAHALHVTRAGSGHPAPGLELARARPRWRQGRGGGGQADPPLGPGDVAEVEDAHRHAPGGEELDAPVALGTVEVHLDSGAAKRLAQRAPQERLTELEGRPELHGGVAPLGRAGADSPGQLHGGVLVVAHPHGRRAPELHVELDRRIAHRLGERGQLGQAVEPLAGPAQGGESVVAGREEDSPVGGRRDDRERLLDEPERLLGGV